MKSIDAFDMCKRPVLVEDAGIVIDALDGFPGPYSSFVFDTIGNKGILKLLNGKKNRQAKFVSVMAYCDKKLQPKIFEGIVTGKISTKIVGKGWGYDPIFIPYSNHNNTSKETYAISSNKNKTSHRYKSLQKFAKWWLQ
jgi:XTP/dITP diphosphohydrolase